MVPRRKVPVKVTVLYEDQRGKTHTFGFHELVGACLFDLLDGEYHTLRRAVEARPMKGAPKLLQACQADIDDIACDGRHVIAVFDEDRVRDLLQLPPTASEPEIISAIHRGHGSLTVILLKRNLETVLRAVAGCDRSLDAELLKRALEKDLLAREDVLCGLARELKRPVRDCLLRAVPSLSELVSAIARRL